MDFELNLKFKIHNNCLILHRQFEILEPSPTSNLSKSSEVLTMDQTSKNLILVCIHKTNCEGEVKMSQDNMCQTIECFVSIKIQQVSSYFIFTV